MNKRATTVSSALLNLVQHPFRILILNWNWKSALMSAWIRGGLFFFMNMTISTQAAVQAMFTEMCFRSVSTGFYAAITQSFRNVQPQWAANLTTMILLPVLSHSAEFFVHRISGTSRLSASIFASILFTVLSTAFNLHAMRRGILITGEKNLSLVEDLRRVPAILFEFLMIPAVLLKNLFGDGERADELD
jgi:hypothetical protein